MPKDLLFLTGSENFSEIIEEGAYYVDKTSYLKELFLTSTVKNPLFIRPRRFGKTLNMSMIKEFCEINYQNPSDKSRQQKLFIDNGRNIAVAGVEISLEEFTTSPDLSHNIDFDTFMTLMLHTGYVTYSEDSVFLNNVRIRIPNREVYEWFKVKQKLLYGENNPEWFNQALRLVDLLMENNVEEASSLMNDMLVQFLSVRNYGSELYYHGFMLGVIGLAASTRNLIIHEEL
jgi:hypothetical protein